MSILPIGLLLVLTLPFILAAWTAFLHWHRAARSQYLTPDAAMAEAGPFDPVGTGFGSIPIDVEAVLRDALITLVPAPRVRMELAIGARLIVPVDSSTLRSAVRNAVLTAIEAVSGGQVLITAAALGGQLHIRITDDGPGTDCHFREASMRPTEVLVALHGGSLSVEARLGQGTTVTIRLPMPATTEQEARPTMQLAVLDAQAA